MTKARAAFYFIVVSPMLIVMCMGFWDVVTRQIPMVYGPLFHNLTR